MKLSTLKKDLKKEWAILLCLFLTIILRIPSLFEPFWYGDEGIYLALGQALKKGVVLYSGIHDNKPPLLYILASIADNVFWFRAMLLIWTMATISLFWALLEKLFGKDKRKVNLALFFFTILANIPLIEGNIANSEIFMIGPVILGILLIFPFLLKPKTAKVKPLNFLLSGVFFSLSFLLKVPGLFDFFAILAVLAFAFDFKKETFKKLFSSVFILSSGFAILIILSFIYFYFKGAFFEYLTSGFLQNFGYLSSWKTGSMTSSGASTQSGLMLRGIILAGLLGVLYIVKSHLSRKNLLIFIWFLFGLFAALLSERPYPHYLIQLLAPASLVLATILFSKKPLAKIVSLFLIAITTFSIIKVGFWTYKTVDYYSNFTAFALGQKTRDDYFNYFGGHVTQTYLAAEYLIPRTANKEKLFIWGDEPYLYALSRRVPVGRYTVAYHIVDFNGYEETLDALNNNPPFFIVINKQEKRPFPEFFEFVDSNYKLEKEIGNLDIYHLNSTL